MGSGSARLICGHMQVHHDLECQLAALKHKEDALLFSSGYLANVGSIPALVGEDDAIFSDALNHASIVDGVRLSKARRYIYPHADVGELERQLQEHQDLHPQRRRLVVTDSVFSMDGDLSPLPALVELCERRGAIPMGDAGTAVAFSRDLLERDGILVPPIRPPTVPEGSSRLRLTLSSAHTSEQIQRLLLAFERRRPA